MSLLAVRVRLRIKLKNSSKSIELPVLVNGGAESLRPCLVVDETIAESLGVWPPEEAEVYTVEEASSTSSAYLLPDFVELELLDEKGGVLSKITADLVIQIGLTEPLITDVTIDALGIQVVSFGKGLWRHKKDPENLVRSSTVH